MFFLNFFSLYRIFFIKIINEVVNIVNFKIGDFAVRFCACQTSCYFGLRLVILFSLLKFHSRHCFPENFSKMMILIVFVGSCTFINGLKILVVFLACARRQFLLHALRPSGTLPTTIESSDAREALHVCLHTWTLLASLACLPVSHIAYVLLRVCLVAQSLTSFRPG